MDIKWSGSYYSLLMKFLVGTGVICQMITLGYSQGDPTGASCVTVVNGLPGGGRFTQSCSPLVFPCTGQRVAYVGDCGFYYWCTDRQILKCPCPPGTAFDITAGICVRDADCSCPVSATTSTTSSTTPKMTTSFTSDMFISTTTSNPDDIEPDEGALASKKMIYIIVGVLVGVIVLVVVIVVVIIICRRRNHLSRIPSDKGSGTDNPNYGIRPYVKSDVITSSDGIYATVNTEPGYGSQQTSLTYSTVAKPKAPPASNATDSEPIRSWSAARNSEVAVMNEWNDPVYANS